MGLFLSSVQWGFRRDEAMWRASLHELYRRAKIIPEVPKDGFTVGVIFHWLGTGRQPDERFPKFDSTGLAMKRFSRTRGWEAHVLVAEPQPGQTRWEVICGGLITAVSAMEADATRRRLPDSATEVLRIARSLCSPEPELEA